MREAGGACGLAWLRLSAEAVLTRCTKGVCRLQVGVLLQMHGSSCVQGCFWPPRNDPEHPRLHADAAKLGSADMVGACELAAAWQCVCARSASARDAAGVLHEGCHPLAI